MNPLFSLKQMTTEIRDPCEVNSLLQEYGISDPETMLSLGDVALSCNPSNAFRHLVLTDWQTNMALRRAVIAATMPCIFRSLVDWPHSKVLTLRSAADSLNLWTLGNDDALIVSMKTINALSMHELYDDGRRQNMSSIELMVSFAAEAIVLLGTAAVYPEAKGAGRLIIKATLSAIRRYDSFENRNNPSGQKLWQEVIAAFPPVCFTDYTKRYPHSVLSVA